jgi:hypothetical protein
MCLAFAIGIVLAEWAASEVRTLPVVNPNPDPPGSGPVDRGASRSPGEAALRGTDGYAHLDDLLLRLKARPEDRALIIELRDGILATAGRLAIEKKRLSIQRAAIASARAGDVEGMEECLKRLRRTASSESEASP